MKTTLILLAFTVAALAAGTNITFNVTCPACKTPQNIEARNVRAVGGYSTNIAGVQGSMVSSNADFRCIKCKLRFPAEIRPRAFVPLTIATPNGR